MIKRVGLDRDDKVVPLDSPSIYRMIESEYDEKDGHLIQETIYIRQEEPDV